MHIFQRYANTKTKTHVGNKNHENSSENFCNLAGKNTLTPLDVPKRKPACFAFALAFSPPVVWNLEMRRSSILADFIYHGKTPTILKLWNGPRQKIQFKGKKHYLIQIIFIIRLLPPIWKQKHSFYFQLLRVGILAHRKIDDRVPTNFLKNWC